MAPKKQVDQVEARHGCELAMKQQVAIPDIINDLTASGGLSPEQAEGLARYLDKYQKGTLKAPAVTQLMRTLVGIDKVKESLEKLVPGYTTSWAPAPHDLPIIV